MATIDADLGAWLASRLGAAIGDPPHRSTRGPARDAADMLVLAPPPDAVSLAGLVVRFVYRDTNDCESERTIRCSRAWSGKNGLIMTGFCLLRKEPRTFRIDRIIELIDVSTGEVFAAHEFIELIGLSYVYTNTQLFLEKVRYGLKVLMAVAAIDGNVYADELEAILRWADDLAFDFGIDFDDNMQNIIIKTARNMRPTKDEAIAAIEKCSQTPGDARRILKAIKNVVYADDGMQPEEHYLIRVLEQAALKAL